MGAIGDLRIQRASAKDLSALARFPGQHQLLDDRFARQRDGRGLLLVAWVSGEPVGRVYLWLEPAEEREIRDNLPGVALLLHLWVHEDSRNQGVGSALVDAAETELRQRGHRRVALGIDPGNHGAMRLYARLGYRPWPHPDIRTTSMRFLSNGDRVRLPETCRVLVRELSTNDAG
jgi:GNAT superfamily N-acetyltransferase